jgi:HD-GYP domain-containing protein (c-di-GMP phosphodiesterase class II)
MEQHPDQSARILEPLEALHPGLSGIVGSHHEAWDGGGYPDGLAGEQIPLMARILAVADAFSALTTDRPYRKGMPPGRALGVLEAGAGAQWDAECVAAFLRVSESYRSMDGAADGSIGADSAARPHPLDPAVDAGPHAGRDDGSSEGLRRAA